MMKYLQIKLVGTDDEGNASTKTFKINNCKEGLTVQAANAFINAYEPVYGGNYELQRMSYFTVTESVVFPEA